MAPKIGAGVLPMAAEWFYAREEVDIGPVSGGELKRLAASGALLPTDEVWREGLADWVEAGSIKGLFDIDSTPAQPPPPLPILEPATPPAPGRPPLKQRPAGAPGSLPPVLAEVVSPPPLPPPGMGSTSSRNSPRLSALPPSLPQGHGSFDEVTAQVASRLKREARGLGSNLKAAVQLTARQAERTTLANTALPNAFHALGKQCYESGSRRDEWPELHQRVDALEAEIKAIHDEAAAQPQATGFAEKTKVAARAAKDLAQVQSLKSRAKHALTELGKAAFTRHAQQAGPPAVVDPIVQAQTKLAALDAQIAELSQAKPGVIFTPKRLAIGGLAALGMLLLLAMVLGLKR
ncbi:MAG: DUF4339 domain-containing protein [Planctomycetia bacterium]|nr:DUF4339 domain-containing protein [Planctomycetia bacterium]